MRKEYTRELKTLEEIKQDAVIERLLYFHGFRQMTADSLGLSRRTLFNMIQRIEIERPEDFKKIPVPTYESWVEYCRRNNIKFVNKKKDFEI